MEWLGISFSKSKTKNSRRESVLNKKEIKQFKMKSKSLNYNLMRSSPKIEGTVELCSRYELSKSEFPFVEEPKNLPSVGAKRYGINTGIFGGADDEQDDQDNVNLIVFTIGGMSHNEISALERLVLDKRVNHRLIIGSTSIITAKDYIEQLKNLSLPYQNDPNAPMRKVDSTDIALEIIR